MIDKDTAKAMTSVADTIAEVLKSHSGKPLGFALFVFEFGGNGGSMNLVSNAQREGLIGVLKELIGKMEEETLGKREH